MSLENITFEGKRISHLLIEESIQKDIREIKKKRAKVCIRTKCPMYRNEENVRKEVRYMKVKGYDVDKMNLLIDFINEKDSIDVFDVMKLLKSSRSLANRYLKVLASNFHFDITQRSRNERKMYKALNHIPKDTAIDVWVAYLENSYNLRKSRKFGYNTPADESSKVDNDHLQQAIVLHATCEATKVPWHSERVDVKSLFEKLAMMNASTKIVKIVSRAIVLINEGE